MQKELEQLGLSEKEAKVYLASIELGPATADQLAKQAKIVRPTTYLQIKALMEMGLMSTYEEGKKTFFTPESPELLRRLISRQKDELREKEFGLQALLPVLLERFGSAGERPVVRFFPGKEGIVAVREESLGTKDKKTFGIFSPEKYTKMFGKPYLEEYSSRREALSIHSKGIYTYASESKPDVNKLTERRAFLNKELPLTVDIYIFDDKLAILSLEGAVFGLVIQSKEISESARAIFDYLWEKANPFE